MRYFKRFKSYQILTSPAGLRLGGYSTCIALRTFSLVFFCHLDDNVRLPILPSCGGAAPAEVVHHSCGEHRGISVKVQMLLTIATQSHESYISVTRLSYFPNLVAL